MNQQLVISSIIVDYLATNLPVFSKSEVLDVIELIEQNVIVCDHNKFYFNSLLNQIEKLEPSSKKEEIKKIINYWILEKKLFVNCDYQDCKEKEIFLADSTQDRIFMQPLLSKKEVDKYRIKYKNIETHNTKSFINPLPSQRLKHLPTTINLEKGIFYDLINILDPFLRTAKQVRIEDPYLPNKFARHNAFMIMRKYPDISYDLVFLNKILYSDNKAEKKDIYDSFIYEISQLNQNGSKISFHNQLREKKHRERYIFTESIQIYLPGGLDFLRPDGFISTSSYDEPSVREIRIEKLSLSSKLNTGRK